MKPKIRLGVVPDRSEYLVCTFLTTPKPPHFKIVPGYLLVFVITITCLCDMLQYFMAVKVTYSHEKLRYVLSFKNDCGTH